MLPLFWNWLKGHPSPVNEFHARAGVECTKDPVFFGIADAALARFGLLPLLLRYPSAVRYTVGRSFRKEFDLRRSSGTPRRLEVKGMRGAVHEVAVDAIPYVLLADEAPRLHIFPRGMGTHAAKWTTLAAPVVPNLARVIFLGHPIAVGVHRVEQVQAKHKLPSLKAERGASRT